MVKNNDKSRKFTIKKYYLVVPPLYVVFFLVVFSLFTVKYLLIIIKKEKNCLLCKQIPFLYLWLMTDDIQRLKQFILLPSTLTV